MITRILMISVCFVLIAPTKSAGTKKQIDCKKIDQQKFKGAFIIRLVDFKTNFGSLINLQNYSILNTVAARLAFTLMCLKKNLKWKIATFS